MTAKELAQTVWPLLVIKHTVNGACNFQNAANELAEIIYTARLNPNVPLRVELILEEGHSE